MRMLLYYMLHSLKNQILKLCKTWVVVFFAVCLLFGVGIGIFAATMEEAVVGDDVGYEDYEGEYEEYPDEEPDESFEEMTEEDIAVMHGVVSLVVGGIILLYLMICVYTGDKSGSSVFLMADVNLLFSAPLKPQTVLMFRLACQIGMMAFASVYILFQIPNLHYNMGLSVEVCVAIMVVWALMLIYGRLISVLTYSVTATYTRLKKYILPFCLAVPAVISVAFLAYHKLFGTDIILSLFSFFNGKSGLFIPIGGWLKGIFVYALEGNILLCVLMTVLSLLGIAFLVWFIWSLKVDFYEDAMYRSAEVAEKLAHAQSDGKSLVKRKKDRADKLNRNMPMKGSGANAIFYKEMYNRFRFARLGIFTKTAVFYLCIGVLLAVIFEAPIEISVLIFAVAAFFRALGDTVTKEIAMDIFLMIPERPFVKLLWAHLAAAVNCALDVLPALLVGSVLIGSVSPKLIVYLLIIVSIDLYSTSISTLIDLIMPSSVGMSFKQVVAVMFVYFGLAPVAIVGCIAGVVARSVTIGLIGGGVTALLVAIGAIAICSKLLSIGRK